MHNRRRLIATSLSLAVAAAALAGCGSDGGGGGSSDRLKGTSLTVGSKDFTENILVGEMLVQALENEGAKVKSQTNLGGTSVARDALKNGEIDVYPEYTGTGWTVHLKQEKPSQDPAELFKAVSEKDMADNKIKWSGQSPFNDTYGFASSPDLTKKEGEFDFDSMAAYLKANPDTKVCMETEFPDRPDGLVLFEKATGYKIPQSQIQILDTGLIYTETSKGKCDFGEVFTTDGRIAALDLTVLTDDKQFFAHYNPSVTMKKEFFDAHPEIAEVTAPVTAALTNEVIIELNKQVDVEGRDPSVVARDWMVSQGFVTAA